MNAVGQNHHVGVRGGPNISNINPSNFTIQHEYRLGFSAGFSYEYLFKKHFWVGADFIYNQRGFTNKIIFTDDLGNPTSEK